MRNIEKRPRRTRAEWTEEVSRWRSSGQTAEQYAAEHGLHPRTLVWWAHEIGKSGRASKTQRGRSKFLPVVVRRRGDSEPWDKAAVVEVVLANGRSLRVPVAADAAGIARLADALEGVRPC